MPQFNNLGAYAFSAIRLAALSAFLSAALLALGTTSSLAQQGDTGGGLVGASSNNFPPVNALDSDGELTGFGRELSDAVLEAVGAKVTHVHSGQWTKVLEMLDSGEADFIHDTGYTDERTSFLDYTDPILEMPERIFVLDDRFDINSFADLTGKRVACVDQHITHLYLKQFPEITCHIVKRPVEGLNALAEGAADAFIYPKQIGLYMALGIGMRDRVKMVGEPLRTLTWHMTVKKGNTPVVDLLNQGLAKVRADGTYDRIYSKWFGEPLLAGFSTREVAYLVGGSVLLALLAAGAAFAAFFALRMRRARDALAQSIAERERAEAMLGRNEQRHAGVLDIAQEAIITIDADHRIETFNQGAETVFGYSADEILGQPLDVLIPSQFRAAHDAHIDDFNREPGASRTMINRGEISGLRKDGTEFPAEASILKLRVDGENVFSVVLRDITDRKRIESDLREREELYRVTFDSAAVGIVHVSPDGHILRANQKLCGILGYEHDELVGLSHWDVTVPDDKADDSEMARKLLAGEISSDSREKRYYRKDGSIVWVNLTIALVRDDAGDPDHYISIIEDITARKELEKTLQRSAMAINSAAETIALFDADDRLVQFNRRFANSFPNLVNITALGMTFEEIMRALVDRGTMLEAVGREEEWIAERMEKHRNPGDAFELALKEGYWIQVSEQRLPDGGIATIGADITKQKQIEADLREREELYRVTFELAAVGIAHIGPKEGRFLRVNQKLCDILGYDSEELLGLSIRDVTPRDDLGDDIEAQNKIMAGAESGVSREKRYIRKDGSVIWVNLTIALVRDDAGEPDYNISIIEDITERKELEATLRRAAIAIDSASETITLYDADDRLIQLNQGFANDHPDFKNAASVGMTFEEIARALVATGSIVDAKGREEEWLAERLEKHRNPGGPFEIAFTDGRWILVNEQRLPDGGTASIAADITKQKQIEAELREREELYRVTFDSAAVGIVHVSPDSGRILRANQKLCEILGYELDELLGLSHQDVTVPDDKAQDVDSTIKLLTGEISNESREKRYFRKDGSIIWANLTVALVRDVSGEPEYFISVVEDITERKELEKTLQRSAMAIDSAAEMITLFDADDRLIQYNQTFLDSYPELKNLPSLDLTFEEILRTIFATGTKAEAEGHVEEWIAERMEKHRNPGAPFEVALKGGRWILVSVHRLPDGGTASIASDITELKQTEEAVRSNERRLNAIIGLHRDAIVIVDGEGLIRFANTAAERILSRRAEDLIDKPFGIPLAGGDIVEVEIAGREIRIAEMQAVPFNWEGTDALLVTLRDITERRQAESSAQQLRSQLEHAARLSTAGDLAAGLAHEINQPLTAINNYIQASVRLLRSDHTRTDDAIEGLEKAARQVLRAGDIVTWLRGVVSKEEGQKSELDLSATIEEVANFLEVEIRARNAELKLELPPSLPPIVGDKVQIQQVVLNLIQNSLQEAKRNTNPTHEITVRAWKTTEGSVVTEISDNGPGVPSERHKDLFSAFFTTKADGLGLGLSISKSIVEEHGGRIWLVTEAEQGATFAFTLRTAEEATSSAVQMAHASD